MRLDGVKHRLASYVSAEITEKYGIPLDVEEVEVRSLNELCLKNVTLYDLFGDTIMHTGEARVCLQTKKLMNGEIRVNTLIFAAPDIRLSRATPDADLNVQYLIDILGSDKEKEDSRIDLRINQMLVYDGFFSYDVLSKPLDSPKFDPNHIAVSDFACNLSLKRLCDGELDLYVRSISGKERCGFDLERLRAHVTKEKNCLRLEELSLKMPSSSIVSDNIVLCTDSTWNDIALVGHIDSDCFTPDDIAPFVDLPKEGISPVAFRVNGFWSQDSLAVSVSALAADYSYGAKADIKATAPFDEQMNGRMSVDDCFANKEITDALISFVKLDTLDYDIADKLGEIFVKGEMSFSKDLIGGEIFLDCNSGRLVLDGSLVSDGCYSLSVNGRDLKLNTLMGVDGLKGCNLAVNASGNFKDAENYASISGRVANLVYNGYSYAPIGFEGKCTATAITGKISADDPNVKMQLTARYNVDDEKILKIKLDAEDFVPADLKLIKTDKRQELAFGLNGEIFDYGDGKTIVNAKIDNLSIVNNEDTTFIRNFYVSDNQAGDDRLFIMTSDFANASIYGSFDFESIMNSLTTTIKSHLPAFEIASIGNSADLLTNDFYYDIAISNSTPLTEIFDIPVSVLEPSRIKGVLNERENIFTVDASINKVDFDGALVRSLSVTGKSGSKGVDLNMQFNKPLANSAGVFDYNNVEEDIVVRLNANVADNKIRGIVNWNNFKSDDTMMGMVRMDAAFDRNEEQELELSAKIHNDSIIHRNKVWYISEGTVSGNMDKLAVKNIGLSSDGQNLKVEGIIGKEQTDSVKAYLKNVDVATVFDFINLQILDFGGQATGTALLTGTLSAPNAGGRLDITDFSIDEGVLGRGDIYVGWEDETKSIVLDASIYNDDNELTTVKGYLSQPNDTITLMIDANNVNAVFLGKKLSGILSDIDGGATGKVHLHGSWSAVDLEGAVAMNCSAKVNANNTRYYFGGDSMRFSKGVMAFENTRLYDSYGNQGSISGPLKHEYLDNWTCNFNIKTNEMLVYESLDFGSLPFYGTIFATGDALLRSDSTGLLLKANLKSTPGSRLVYNSNETSGARDNSFVTFTDNSKRKKKEQAPVKEQNDKDLYNTTASKLTLDFMLDVNDALELKVYTNLQTDDYISLYGNGPINAVFNDKTGFNMKGHLNLSRGTYKFTIQDIFPKVFDITKGSTLVFNGDPYKAELDLKTKYLVPSASLSDLTTEIAKRKTVKVNCIMNITGNLESPNLEFDLELPEGSEEERGLLASVASTPDQKNMQFVYLLGVGKFYTFDASIAQAGDTNSSTAVESLISNTISGQLNNMLGKIINNGNWDISGNISTSERGWNSMEVEGMLRGRLLDNRLQINGNLGYRENPIANRNFIGDFELLWLLSPKYNWNIKAYSKTNDRYFSKTDLTTQGIGTSILLEFDSWKWWGKKKEKKKEDEKKSDKPDEVENVMEENGAAADDGKVDEQ